MEILVADGALVERRLPEFGRLLSEQTVVPPWNLKWAPGSIDDPESATGFLHMLHQNGGRFVVALDDDIIAGVGVTICLSCDQLLDDLHVRELGANVGDEYLAAVVVDPEQRKHGVFTRLAELRVQIARERAAASRNGHKPTAWVRTHPDVDPVIRVYTRMGFELCGEYAPPLGGVCAPRVVMKMMLDAVPTDVVY
ncbi:MAG: GNAT family N-acetyltransferase [Bdellovibrionales bacterium]|nr:GNAT family N-acetyltransferase [Bdellovibrionales bacterium]